MKNVRGEQLGYYRNRGSCFEGCPYTTAQELVVHTDGQCGAWMSLLICCAGAHGIDTQRVRVEPDPDAFPADCLYASPVDGFLVKTWEFAAGQGTSGCASYSFKFDACGSYSARWSGGPEVTDVTGVGGQDSPNPLAWFAQHWIVLYDDEFYDPSYGNGHITGSLAQAALAFEQAAIAGYYGTATTDGSGNILLGARKDVSELREIRFRVVP